MVAKQLFPDEILVIGWENGGVVVVCKECDFELGGGGCDCCSDNNVTLEDLLRAAEVKHECEKGPME